MRRLAPVIAALLVLFALAEEANAGIPPMLRRGTRRMWAGGAFGPAFWMETGGATQIKLTQTFGFHFKRAAEGPAIAFDISESFGSGVTVLQITPRFVWDIPIVDGLGFYLSPDVGIGFGHAFVGTTYGYYGATSSTGYSAFELKFSFKGKLVLGDRGYVYMQPMGVDILIGDSTTARWDFMFGGGVIF